MVNETIAIIGATEQLGAILFKCLARADYRLLLFSNNISHLKTMVKEIKKISPAADLHSFECLVDASWEADIIVFAVPAKHEPQIAERIKQVATQKIVIRLSDHFEETSAEKAADAASTERSLQELLPHSKLVEVHLGTPPASLQQISCNDSLIAVITSINTDAAEKVREIFKKAGFQIAAPEERINSFHN